MPAILLIFLATLVSAGPATAEVAIAPGQAKALQQLAPGLKLTPELMTLVTEVVYSRDNMTVEQRIREMARISGVDQLPADQRMKRRICIWDIAGRAGPVFSAAQDQRAQALELGVDLEMIPYTVESIMVEEFKAGRCDAALMSGLRARTFNTFTGTIDAIGAVPTREHMRTLLEVTAHPKMAGRMVRGDYVVLGVFPGGAAHIFVNDRQISSLTRAAGKRIAVLDYDPVQARMIAGIGATPIATDITRAPGMFNNGAVDILAAPLVAYEVLELYKGMSPNGGIVDHPLAQITMQLIGHRDKFPNEVAQLIREATLQRYDEIMEFVQREQAKIPERWWIEIGQEDKRQYEVMMQEARLSLRAQGYYDAEMLTLERKIRCKFDPARAECGNPVE